jgi:protein-disulfide isomerase
MVAPLVRPDHYAQGLPMNRTVPTRRAALLIAAAIAGVLATAARASADAMPAADPDPATPVAAVAGETLTWGSVADSVKGKLDAEQREYLRALHAIQFKRAQARDHMLGEAVQSRIEAMLVERDGRARHLSADAVYAAIKAAPVTDAEARQFFSDNILMIRQPYEQVEGRIKEKLADDRAKEARRAYVAALAKKYGVMTLREPLRTLIDGEGPARGPADATVTIVEFADFECPFCLRLEPTLQKLLKEYPRDVRLVWRQLPLVSLHAHASEAARAAACADRQARFWPLHDALFEHQQQLGSDAIKSYATGAGLDADRFTQCLATGQPEREVERDVGVAEAIGITGTPALFVNGRFLDGAVPYADIAALVEDELARRRHAPGPAAGR